MLEILLYYDLFQIFHFIETLIIIFIVKCRFIFQIKISKNKIIVWINKYKKKPSL